MRFTRLFFIGLLFVTAVNSTYVPCDSCIDRATPSVLATINLRLYSNQVSGGYKSVSIGDALDLLDSIDLTLPSIVYVSGWTEIPDSDSNNLIVSAYRQLQNHNIFAVDWQVISTHLFYPYSAFSVEGVGWTVANALDELVAAGLPLSTLHLVGHSLGAQICGFIGRYMNSKPPRITGLDPAGPGFYQGLVVAELTSADAEFVDIIHTDAGVFGTAFNLGTVDFRPNGGISPQPGCLLSGNMADICSHARSWQYYAEALLNENAFIGLKCSSYLEFTMRSCSSKIGVPMGYSTPLNASGIYYFQTNGKSAYGRGNNGKVYTSMLDPLVTTTTNMFKNVLGIFG